MALACSVTYQHEILMQLSVQVVEESSTSALFSLAMVIVYDECIISQVLTVQTLLT